MLWFPPAFLGGQFLSSLGSVCMDDTDIHLGKRLRRRRRLLGLTQKELADAAGVQFQQIQKYECAANRMSAARLWYLSLALEVPISYFYAGLSKGQVEIFQALEAVSSEVLNQIETQELLAAYYCLGEAQRHKFLLLVKAIGEKGENVDSVLTQIAA